MKISSVLGGYAVGSSCYVVAAHKTAQESGGRRVGTNGHSQKIKLELVLYTQNQRAQGPLPSHPSLHEPGAWARSTRTRQREFSMRPSPHTHHTPKSLSNGPDEKSRVLVLKKPRCLKQDAKY